MHAIPKRPSVALAIVAGVTIASASFGIAFPPREAVVGWLALVGFSALALAVAAVALARAPLDERAFGRAALFGALALRLGALAAPVSLSDDIHRYVWDGTLLVDGHDPFASRPVEVAHLPGLGDDALARLNSPRYYSVYPPLAQASFAMAVVIARAAHVDPTLVLRVLFVLAELCAVWACIVLLRRLERARGWALLYAWHPLAFWEVAAGAHTEALMVPLLLFAILAALDARPLRAGVLLGLAASAKLTALVLAPILLVHLARRVGARRALAFAWSGPLVLALTFLPFASATLVPHITESLALYSRTFSFNAPIYYGARFLLGYREGLTPPVDAVLMPLLSIATLAWIGALAWRRHRDARALVSALALAYLGYLVLSRVVHPWYLLAPLAMGAIAERRAIALYALLALLSYLRYDPLGDESSLVLAIPLAPLAVAVAKWALGQRTITIARSADDPA